MPKKRLVFEQGHRRKYLVVVDDVPEVDAALFFAAGRIGHSSGQLVLLYVIEPADFQTMCATCHADGTLAATLQGPHGMHNVDDALWIHDKHKDFYELSAANCQTCHGENLQGTVLARAAANRNYSIEGNTISIAKGTPVSCTLCHSAPGSGGGD